MIHVCFCGLRSRRDFPPLVIVFFISLVLFTTPALIAIFDVSVWRWASGVVWHIPI